jgi:hypothetical protein
LVAAGTQIGQRYRLIERVGMAESGPVEFWLARDSVLARQVGVTVVARAEADERALWAAPMVTALLRWGQFSYLGCPRILDVVGVGHGPDLRGLPEQLAVVVVTDWAPGPALLDFLAGPCTDCSVGIDAEPGGDGVTARGPVPSAVALAMVAPLAAAADAAHAEGLLLGCGRPELLRIAQAGTRTAHVHLEFLLPDPVRGPDEDVRGLGAVLYALLTGQWPRARLTAELAPVGGGGQVVGGGPPEAPHVLNPSVSEPVSELAMSALGFGVSGAAVPTSAAWHRAVSGLMLEEVHPHSGGGDGRASHEVAGVSVDTQRLPDPALVGTLARAPRMARWVGRQPGPRVLAGVACLVAVVAVLGLAVVGLGVVGSRGGSGSSGTGSTPPSVAASGPAPNASPRAARVVTASVYDPTGEPDNPSQVWRALGADPKAGWSTDTYLQPFPALKPGVGIMVGFAGPVQLTSLTITSPSVGSQVQIRSAPSPVSALGETTVLASTTLQAGETVVPLADSQPVTHVLVWITKLGGGGDDNVTAISNLRFERATD